MGKVGRLVQSFAETSDLRRAARSCIWWLLSGIVCLTSARPERRSSREMAPRSRHKQILAAHAGFRRLLLCCIRPRRSMGLPFICRSVGVVVWGFKCRHIFHTWSVWDRHLEHLGTGFLVVSVPSKVLGKADPSEAFSWFLSFSSWLFIFLVMVRPSHPPAMVGCPTLY